MMVFLKDNFPNKSPLRRISALFLNSIAYKWNTLSCRNGDVVHNPDGSVEIVPNQRGDMPGGTPFEFSFRVVVSGALTATMTPGEVELGPATILTADGKRIINGTVDAASGCFTNNLTASPDWTITVPSGKTKWVVWAEVDVSDGAETWAIYEGETVDPLTTGTGDTEIKKIRQKKLVELTIVGDIITGVHNRQCGNIDISRL